ncbi:transport permease protein [Thermopolyspora flexuosa]|uniref:Transport permease protein n=1 Tax=Thermopolyspora flexuosa TaxID=103836 RepID=A0A543J0B3_9ACTN|nr:ABC transporter permease [Thermopolyspora flexuosa]TQM76261.1 ABC-2 type transport system permease protein [Thermopolyspora flexuosa]GGM66010.1 transport permease protein [Thermopolyspora flexuosa]
MTALILARHYLRATFRSKLSVLFSAIQPIMFLVLFGPLFDRSGVGSWDVLVPGLLVQLALMSAGLAGFGIFIDRRFGVLERLRVTPAGRTSLLLGRVLRDVVVLLVQSALLLALGWALGLRAPLAGVLLGLALLVVLATGLASLSYAIALVMPDELFPPVASTAVVPLMLLSGALLPMSLAPPWLDVLSRLTPFRYVVEALRAFFSGSYGGAAVAWGVLAGLALLVIGVALGTRLFHRENA